MKLCVMTLDKMTFGTMMLGIMTIEIMTIGILTQYKDIWYKYIMTLTMTIPGIKTLSIGIIHNDTSFY